MKLSNTSQYAINIMVAITKHNEPKLLNAKSISENLNIPYKYLTKIMPLLVNSNLIISTKGREGGYTLAKEAKSINIVDILEAVNDSIHDSKCILKAGMCDENNQCAMHGVWQTPKKAMKTMFTKNTLEEISS
jgi:Rrf2 family protein